MAAQQMLVRDTILGMTRRLARDSDGNDSPLIDTPELTRCL